MSTIKVNAVRNTATNDGGIDIDASGHVTVDGQQLPTAGQLSNRNKIINGAMRIDQRNGGAALSVNSGTDFFAVDRFTSVGTASAGVFSVQRSSTAPDGFSNSLVATVTTTDSALAAADQYYISQLIEGNNIADLDWGTSSAETVTLSFYVRSSVTGTFGGAFRNSATNRAYPFTYSITTADTWEKKSITVSGDTSGTWLTTNGVGIHITWGLGFGSNWTGSSGAWSSNNYKGATGTTNLMATNGATFYITGVQLEVGGAATSFEHRSYGDELTRCQRYYQNIYPRYMAGQFLVTNEVACQFVPFYVLMRSTPTATYSGMSIKENNGSFATTSLTGNAQLTENGLNVVLTRTGAAASDSFVGFITSANMNAEL